ncbi:MltA domain-containing protein [Euryhalocaulis sp.]|uniref:murein transglycosylase A n=1 Tax=Euryhalocaulis sp. TaxID=2744307 RepID=UPI00257DD737|nr:MltA domain-containing protein [Euryhalocaulis sp.]
MIRRSLLASLCFLMAACGRDDAPEPEQPAEPEPLAVEQEIPDISLRLTDFEALDGWAEADAAAALTAFQRSCTQIAARPDEAPMNPKRDWAGIAADWRAACEAAAATPVEAAAARAFFQTHFLPVSVTGPESDTGLLTGYYEPELVVSRARTSEFSEPILGRPEDLVTADLGLFDPELVGHRVVGQVETGKLIPYDPRAEISTDRAPVLAWGRPADVFFLQVQGSGRIRFDGGGRQRAVFAAHNGLPYRSIGRVLIDRGELTLSQASKAGIERWMDEAGYDAAKALMNENPRYVFFGAEPVDDPARGPRGAQGAPLTPMASMAVDPDFHAYGAPVLINTRIPRQAGDAEAEARSLLVIAQDTGGAIEGPMRGDLFFGTGDQAGDLAGVMKHPARWTVLLPSPLALKLAEPAT